MRKVISKSHQTKRLLSVIIEPIEQRLLMSTYTVNTLSDAANPGAGLVTFRQAVADANGHAGADTIAFSPTVFAAGSQHKIVLTQGEILLTDTTGGTTVAGPGSGVGTIDGNGKSRLLSIAHNAIVSLSGLTLTGGEQMDADANANTFGGGILNAGTLTISNSTVSGNAVVASAINEDEGGDYTAGNGMGGGIYSTGPLTITGSSISGNSVTTMGGVDQDFSPNTGAAFGGGIYSSGGLTLTDDGVSGNTVNGSPGSDDPNGGMSGGGHAAGGGVYVVGSASVLRSIITGNAARAGAPTNYGGPNGSDGDGGGIYVGGGLTMMNSTVSGNTVEASRSSFADGDSGAARGGGVYAGGSATFSGSNISNNVAIGGNTDAPSKPSAGGGVFAGSDAAFSLDTIDGNQIQAGSGSTQEAGAGGGIYGGGELKIVNTSVSDNSVSSQVPAKVSEGRGGGLNVGGGIVVTATSSITGSTIAGNAVTGGEGPVAYANYPAQVAGDGDGGGIFSSAALTISNSTIVNNTATGGAGGDADIRFPGANGADGNGGGIFTTLTLSVLDSTISGNSAKAGAGGQGYYLNNHQDGYPAGVPGSASGGGVDIVGERTIFDNSIISVNTVAGVPSDIAGTADSDSANNLIGAGGGLVNGMKGNEVGFNQPDLSALGDNGGATQTMVPEKGSPAIDRGNNSLVPAGMSTDQRGFARISGSAVDIGATESGNSSIAGTVFNDVNNDGAQDNGEAGRGTIEVYNDANNNGKLDAGEAFTFTDGSGKYVFNELNPGNYKIRQILPTNWKQTTPANNFGWTITLANNQNLTGRNFGEISTATRGGSISGMVFNDINGNGAINSGESGVANVTVYNDANNNGKFDSGELTTSTDGNGNYIFGGLSAGNYKIRQILAANGKQTTPANNFGWTLTLGMNQSLTGKNFGEESTSPPPPTGGSISGTVFNDANGNGVMNSGEAGMVGIEIYNDANNNGKLDSGEATTMTDASGNYIFTNLAAGNYKIRQILAANEKQTTPSNNFGWTLTLGMNQTLSGKNFGEQSTAPTGGSISGTVFNDANGNQKQDTGEAGVSAWTVYIDTNNDGILDNNEVTTQTEADGAYSFAGLSAGTYIVRVIRAAGWNQTTPTNNFGQHETLAANQVKSGILFGERAIS